MSSIRKGVRGTKLLVSGMLALAFLSATLEVSAVPVIGGQLFWTGGDVTITVLPASAGFTSELKLFSADPDIFIATNRNVGTIVTIPAATIDDDHNIGSELIFGIFVQNTGDTFLMGPGTRNSDGLAHTGVDPLGAGVFIVGFEDLNGGGDLDFDDNVFRFEGALAVTPPPVGRVPEPAALALLGIGFAALGLARRRKKV